MCIAADSEPTKGELPAYQMERFMVRDLLLPLSIKIHGFWLQK